MNEMMGMIQEKILQLLCEIKEICDKADINFFLARKTAESALDGENFPERGVCADIWMPKKDFDDFCQIVEGIADREIEGIAMGSPFPAVYYRYVASDTLLYDMDEIGKVLAPGISVRIHILWNAPKSKWKRWIWTFMQWAVESEDLRKAQIVHMKKKKKIILFIMNMIRKCGGKKVFSGLYQKCSEFYGKDVTTHSYYISRFLKAPVVIDKNYFDHYEEIEFEGKIFKVPEECRSILKKTESYYPLEKKENYMIIADSTLPYKEFLKAVSESGLVSKEKLKCRRRYLYHVQTDLKEAERSLQKVWNLLFMTGARYKMWKKYIGRKGELLDLYEREAYEQLDIELKEYLDVLETFANKGYGVCFDDKIWKIALECLCRQGKEEISERLKKYVFPEHMNGILVKRN